MNRLRTLVAATAIACVLGLAPTSASAQLVEIDIQDTALDLDEVIEHYADVCATRVGKEGMPEIAAGPGIPADRVPGHERRSSQRRRPGGVRVFTSR